MTQSGKTVIRFYERRGTKTASYPKIKRTIGVRPVPFNCSSGTKAGLQQGPITWMLLLVLSVALRDLVSQNNYPVYSYFLHWTCPSVTRLTSRAFRSHKKLPFSSAMKNLYSTFSVFSSTTTLLTTKPNQPTPVEGRYSLAAPQVGENSTQRSLRKRTRSF